MRSQKLKQPGGASPRTYGDACAAAHALDLVGERWALLVIRELMLGPRRFTDLRRGLPGISANVLTQRLEGLEGAGILRRASLPPPVAAPVYELTEWGREAEPIVRALGRWGARSPRHDPTLAFSAAALVLSLRTMFDPERGEGFKKRVGLRVDGESFVARVKKGRLLVEHGDLAGCDCVLSARAPVLAAVIYGGADVGVLADAAELGLEGEAAVVERFARLFPMPAKAPPAPASAR